MGAAGCAAQAGHAVPLVTLHKLADLVKPTDARRKALENIDMIAQGAVDATRTYMNKNGDENTVETPDWGNALKAQIAGLEVLGLTAESGDAKPATESPVARILAAVPKVKGQ